MTSDKSDFEIDKNNKSNNSEEHNFSNETSLDDPNKTIIEFDQQTKSDQNKISLTSQTLKRSQCRRSKRIQG